MLPFEKAIETVLTAARPFKAERVDISLAVGRVLSQDVESDIDMPPFNKSAMDGFACRRADLDSVLTVVETIPAGSVPKKSIGPGRCAKIMTGAMVPEEADCVIMKEFVEILSEDTIRFTGAETADNICQKAEDIKAGQVVLNSGSKIGPQDIAVLASVGQTKPLVAVRPRVAVIATGDELVEPSAKPGRSQIRNSNSFQLVAQIETTSAIATNYGTAGDTDKAIEGAFAKALKENDVVIISGGVSVGDFDFVPAVLKRNGMDLLFEKVAIKPGKPTVFGTSPNGYCFGLPGNPVSTFVLFEIMVKPFLYKLMGHDYKPLTVQMTMGKSIVSKKAKRQRWIPVKMTDSRAVVPIEYHGSAHINSLCGAAGLICMDAGVTEIKKDQPVIVSII